MLLIMEVYTEYILTGNNETTKQLSKEVKLEYFRSEDTMFYKILIKVALRMSLFEFANFALIVVFIFRDALFYFYSICTYCLIQKTEGLFVNENLESDGFIQFWSFPTFTITHLERQYLS